MANKEAGQMEPFRLETAFDQIEQLLQKLQEGEVSLEESFRLYEQGMKLLQKCNENIDHVEKQMLQIDEEGHTHEFS
ncbi:exodeoxyribonuclease VII small subunit [Clostridiaceae bacterium Marseille-Q4145]|mgnify:FL=1|nr:exodeoxyribonuclease VII small subunit [Clostridiaceae bacterium Marseille-Q4145]